MIPAVHNSSSLNVGGDFLVQQWVVSFRALCI